MDHADHLMGLELQLEELVERRERATVQHQADVGRLDAEIARLQDELARTVERDLAPPPTTPGGTSPAP